MKLAKECVAKNAGGNN